MSASTHDSNPLLTQLEAAKNRFNPGHAALVAKLLAGLAKFELSDPYHLIRFHECLLFLRAFPHAPSQIPRVERLLNTFHVRIEKLRDANADMSLFDDFDTSGITGTTMQDTLSFDVAQWLVRRIRRNVDIAWDDYWDDYQSERARGSIWPRFIPLLQEDADVEANIRFRGSSVASSSFRFLTASVPNSTTRCVFRFAGNWKTCKFPVPATGRALAASTSTTPRSSSAAKFPLLMN